MSASFDVRDWIGWGAERTDPAWKSKATNWFNELTNYARETRADLDTEVAELDSHITDFNDHLADAGWADGGQTFERQSTSSNTRITDVYTPSSSVQRQIGAIRVDLDNVNTKVQYDSTGGNEIYRINRADRRVEHDSAALLGGSANYYSNWQNYGGGYEVGFWWREPSGFVTWQGLVRRTGAASGAPSAILLTNGGGRKSTTGAGIHVVMSSVGAIRLDTFTNGQLVTQTSIPLDGWVSLNGVRYMDSWR